MSGRTIFGILLVAVGGGLLLDRAGMLDFGQIISSWWPMILIVIAAVQIILGTAPLVGSLILLGVGLLFQAMALDLLPSNLWSYIWPAALIAAGLWLVMARGWGGRQPIQSDDSLSSFVAFGGLNPRVVSDHFEGGSVTAIFGGAEIDLRDSQLAPDGAELDLTTAFGGIEVAVPSEWRVVISGLPLFGGWEDKTKRAGETSAEGPALKISCFAAFGGIEIHN